MISKHGKQAFAAIALGALWAAAPAYAETVHAKLEGFQEVPAVSTVGGGRFKAKIDEHAGSIFWELEYEGLQADALQAHIHFGQRHTNGGITVWLCSNLPSPPTPAGIQICPLRAGSINGTIMAANVVGPGGAQQLPAGGFEQLVRAIRANATYANVHTTASPGGEIRGQVLHGDDHH
ncbi:MAG: CHRD domain-containing protein [Burkholderiaceae bacterium]|nr:CHRD domain-containing protein [Burkholderiaceae bacterium]